jgi:hypothetical protein
MTGLIGQSFVFGDGKVVAGMATGTPVTSDSRTDEYFRPGQVTSSHKELDKNEIIEGLLVLTSGLFGGWGFSAKTGVSIRDLLKIFTIP